MITLTTIPARHHAALAAARVEVEHVTGWRARLVRVYGDASATVEGSTDHRNDSLALPATDHNTRALAVVLAEACGLDVRGGAVASLSRYATHEAALRVSAGGYTAALASVATGGWTHARVVPALADINPTAPDALFRALCACLCALETA